MSSINVTVTGAGEPSVTVASDATVNATVGDGGAVGVSVSPAGAPGPAGKDGVTPAFAVGTVATLSAGSNATVTATTSNGGANVTLDFGLPQGSSGTSAGATTDASQLTTGTLADARLSANVPLLINGLVPASMLPSYVDDVIDAGGTLPGSGEAGKIYVLSSGANANKVYRWSGSAFVEIVASPGSTDAVPEGSTNLYHTTQRAAAAAPVQSVAGRTGSVTLSAADIGDLSTSAVTKLNSLTGSLTLAAGSNVTITPSGSTLTIASTASAPLADATPQPLGIAAVGTSTDAAREDHVHAMPTAMDVGALGPDSIVDGGEYVGEIIVTVPTITITAQPANQTASLSGGTVTFAEALSGVDAAGFVQFGSTTIAAHRTNAATLYTKTGGGAWVSRFVSGSVPLRYGAATESVAVFVSAARGSDNDNDASYASVIFSTSGTSWTPSTTRFYAHGISASATRFVVALENVSYDQTYGRTRGTYLNSQTRPLAVSDDGASWTFPTIPSVAGSDGFYGPVFNDVAYSGSRFVAVGCDTVLHQFTSDGVSYTHYRPRPVVSYSSTGLSWTATTLPHSTPVQNDANQLFPLAVAHGAGRFVAVGCRLTGWVVQQVSGGGGYYTGYPSKNLGGYRLPDTGTADIYTSTDNGTTWTRVNNALPASQVWTSVTFAGGRFIAVAEASGYYATSEDGLTWTEFFNNAQTSPTLGCGTSAYDGTSYYVAGSTANAGVVLTPSITGGTLQATFTVGATLTPSGSLSYQWEKSDDAGATWANVSGGTASTLTVGSLTAQADNSDQYRAVVSATNAAPVTSNAATLTVT